MTKRIADLLVAYGSEVLPRKKSRSDGFYLKRLFSDQIATLDPDEIRPRDIKEYRDRRLLETTPGQVRREMVLLSHVFTVALSEWDLDRKDNPIKLIKKPPAGEARKRRLSDEEWSRFWSEVERCRVPWFKSMVRLALATAMRKSELLRIQWQDFLRDDSTNTRMVAINGKTGHRPVPLSKDAFEILEEWRERDFGGGYGAVFKADENRVNLVFRRACDRANILNYRFHDLRHEAISRYMSRPDLTKQEVMVVSGHKTDAMLWRYVHLKVDPVAFKL